MNTLLQSALGDKPVDCHWLLCCANAVSHGQGLCITPALKTQVDIVHATLCCISANLVATLPEQVLGVDGHD